MKNIKLLMVFMLLATVQLKPSTPAATPATTPAASPTATPIAALNNGVLSVVNKSNMVLGVAVFIEGQPVQWCDNGRDITIGGTGHLNYTAGEKFTNFRIYFKKTDDSGNVVLTNPTDSTTWSIDAFMHFDCPGSMEGCILHIYGNKKYDVTALDVSDPQNPIYSRYCAWWTGSIPAADFASGMTAQAAINDPAVRPMVIMYTANTADAHAEPGAVATAF